MITTPSYVEWYTETTVHHNDNHRWHQNDVVISKKLQYFSLTFPAPAPDEASEWEWAGSLAGAERGHPGVEAATGAALFFAIWSSVAERILLNKINQ